MQDFEPQQVAQPADYRIAVVVSRWNGAVTQRLLEGAREAWQQCGGEENKIYVEAVPGAFEIPLAAQELARTGRYAAVVCLGCVIRGETGHYEYVCGPVSQAIMNVGLACGLPVIFGVLTTDSMVQAMERAGGAVGNKGAEAVSAAMEMVEVLRRARTEAD